MKNNFFLIILIFLSYFYSITTSNSSEQFNFNVTEINILENGNKFVGSKRGKITTDNGIIIDSDNFEYDKLSNILNANGNVIIQDKKNNITLYSENITYYRNDETIFSKGRSKASDNNGLIITADNFEYNKLLNVLNASGNVIIKDDIKNQILYAKDVTYLKNNEEIYSRGKTEALIQSRFKINSTDVTFLKNQEILKSKNKTTINDNEKQIYYLDEFVYNIESYELKGKNILTITNYKSPKSDKFYFKSAILNLKNKNFLAKDTKIEVHKNIFDNSENDPRIKGVSSSGNNNITKINKAIFTSCKKDDGCPPWSIAAKEITHDKIKKQISYNNAILKIYDLPILYFPKFFHPDPTVVRQSGFLKPLLNESNVVGSSITLPYYGVISENKDYTLVTTLFDKNTKMIQNEFRQSDQKTKFLIDTGYVYDYKDTNGKNKNINHIFSKYKVNLDLQNFLSSSINFKIEKTTNDTYLKIFDQYLILNDVKPRNSDILNNQIELILDHENYNFNAEIASFENLQLGNSDKYQYIFPSYSFYKTLSNNFLNGSIFFNSNGNNDLNNTNVLNSQITNNISYQSIDNISLNGIRNNFNLEIKNLNSTGKNSSKYKSSPQIELMSIFTVNSSFPLIKREDDFTNFITPKISLKLNPSDMKDYSELDRSVNVDNIFNLNRLGLSDSFESGRSLTLGLDYKKEKVEDINKYFEFKLATVLRDKEENFIPKTSTLNRKQSNIFGTVSNNFNENISISYNFNLDNDYNTFENNTINTTLKLENFSTSIDFVENNGEMGDSSFITNSTSFNLDETHFVNFNTRRNRKINLTEYYDLVYQYKNDCLIAGINYKKTYYEDRDLKPAENLMFTITLFPLTTFEQKADDLVNK